MPASRARDKSPFNQILRVRPNERMLLVAERNPFAFGNVARVSADLRNKYLTPLGAGWSSLVQRTYIAGHLALRFPAAHWERTLSAHLRTFRIKERAEEYRARSQRKTGPAVAGSAGGIAAMLTEADQWLESASPMELCTRADETGILDTPERALDRLPDEQSRPAYVPEGDSSSSVPAPTFSQPLMPDAPAHFLRTGSSIGRYRATAKSPIHSAGESSGLTANAKGQENAEALGPTEQASGQAAEPSAGPPSPAVQRASWTKAFRVEPVHHAMPLARPSRARFPFAFARAMQVSAFPPFKIQPGGEISSPELHRDTGGTVFAMRTFLADLARRTTRPLMTLSKLSATILRAPGPMIARAAEASTVPPMARSGTPAVPVAASRPGLSPISIARKHSTGRTLFSTPVTTAGSPVAVETETTRAVLPEQSRENTPFLKPSTVPLTQTGESDETPGAAGYFGAQVTGAGGETEQVWPVIGLLKQIKSKAAMRLPAAESKSKSHPRGEYGEANLPVPLRAAWEARQVQGLAGLPALGPGELIIPSVRQPMERLLRRELGDVRVHTSPLVAAFGAEALTTGRQIVFAPGRMQMRSAQGLALLAHELTHVGQPLAFKMTTAGSSAEDKEEAAAREQEKEIERIIEHGWRQAPRRDLYRAATALATLAGTAGARAAAGVPTAPTSAMGPSARAESASGGAGRDNSSVAPLGQPDALPAGSGNSPSATQMDELASKVYVILKQKLCAEFERHRLYA